METTKEPRYLYIPVTDLDIMYIGGLHDQITYGEGDFVEDTDTAIKVLIRDEKSGKILERITCLKQNMASYKTRDRIQRILDKRPIPPPVEESAQPEA